MNRNEIEIHQDDDTSGAVAKAMLGAVTAMALIVMMTVLVFWSGGGIA